MRTKINAMETRYAKKIKKKPATLWLSRVWEFTTESELERPFHQHGLWGDLTEVAETLEHPSDATLMDELLLDHRPRSFNYRSAQGTSASCASWTLQRSAVPVSKRLGFPPRKIALSTKDTGTKNILATSDGRVKRAYFGLWIYSNQCLLHLWLLHSGTKPLKSHSLCVGNTCGHVEC